MNDFQSFALFVKRYSTSILAAAYLPVLTQSFIPFPRNDLLSSQIPAVLSGLLTVLVVAGTFWLRKSISRKPVSLLLGLLLVIVGLACMLEHINVCASATKGLGSLERENYRLTSDQTWPALLWYVGAIPTTFAGVAIIFLYGFVRSAEPSLTLQAIASELSEKLRGFLNRVALSMHSVETGQLGPGRALAADTRDAFRAGAVSLLQETVRVLDRIAEGTLEVRGPTMDVVYGQCVEAVRKRFRALSRDDLDYWASDESTEYLEYNRKLIARGCAVERVFLLQRGRALTEAHREAIERQINMGVVARVAYLEKCQHIAADKALDFGLLDEFAVTFWRHERGRVFRVSAEASECADYAKILDRVVDVCEQVSDEPNGDRSRLTIPHLRSFLKRHNAKVRAENVA